MAELKKVIHPTDSEKWEKIEAAAEYRRQNTKDFSTGDLNINIDEDSDSDHKKRADIDGAPPRVHGFEKNIEKLIKLNLMNIKLVETAAKYKTKNKETAD